MTTRLRKPLNNLLFLTSLLVHGRTPKKKSSTGTEENKVWSECLWWTLTGGIISPQTHFLCSGTFISHCCITLRLSRHFSLHVFFLVNFTWVPLLNHSSHHQKQSADCGYILDLDVKFLMRQLIQFTGRKRTLREGEGDAAKNARTLLPLDSRPSLRSL